MTETKVSVSVLECRYIQLETKPSKKNMKKITTLAEESIHALTAETVARTFEAELTELIAKHLSAINEAEIKDLAAVNIQKILSKVSSAKL